MSDNNYPRVRVINAPGLEDFEADLIMLVSSVTGQMVAVVGDDEGEVFAIPEVHIWDV